MKKNRFRANSYLALILAWTLLVALSLALNLYRVQQSIHENASIEARTHLELNLEYRSLIAQLGGVYASVDKVAPNPYLVAPQKELLTRQGRQLTLLNPAYFTRMIFDNLKSKSGHPIISKITSLKTLNPHNSPDAWERKGLMSFEQGAQSLEEVTQLTEGPYYRVMVPMRTEQGCLKCHAFQGYKVGDVRGGLSIAVPLTPFYQAAVHTRKITVATHFAMWFIGALCLVIFARSQKKQELKLSESEWKFRTLSESTEDMEYWLSGDGRIRFISPSTQAITGFPPQQFVDDPSLLSSIVHPEDLTLFEEGQAQCKGKKDIEFRIVDREGRTRWLLQKCAPLYLNGDYLGNRISNRDITDRKLAEEELSRYRSDLEELVQERTRDLTNAYDELRQSEENLSRIMDVILVGIVIVDACDHTIKDANAFACRMLGTTKEALVGKLSSSFLRSGSPGKEGLEQGEAENCEFLLDTRGREIPILRSEVRTMYRGREHLVESFIDISDRKKAEEELQTLAERLQESNQQLQDFASIASHDLQEPLRKVMAFGDRLAEKCGPALSDQGKDYLERMQSAARRMQIFINDLLTFSRVITKAQPPAPVNLNQLMTEIISDLEVRIEQTAGLVLVDELPTVNADPLQMRQLFQNLIGNSLKFHKKNEPPVVKIIGSWSGTSQYQIVVSDNGIGFDEKYTDKIFGLFQRLHGRSEYEGTGIGLSICKKILERHGGSIKATGIVNQGATFTITLPPGALAPPGQVEEAFCQKGETRSMLCEANP